MEIKLIEDFGYDDQNIRYMLVNINSRRIFVWYDAKTNEIDLGFGKLAEHTLDELRRFIINEVDSHSGNINLINNEIDWFGDVKRFHLNGLEAKSFCPNCGSEVDFDDDDYAMNPIPGDIIKLHFYCKDCENNWHEEVRLKVSVEAV